jgi:hypothetical protein
MDLLLTVTATDRRLTGTACRLGSDIPVAFSGSLELLACLERLVAGETADRPLIESLTESLTERFTTKGR